MGDSLLEPTPGEVLRRWRSRFFTGLCALSAVVVLVPLVSILFYIVRRGLPGLSLSFFTHLPAAGRGPGRRDGQRRARLAGAHRPRLPHRPARRASAPGSTSPRSAGWPARAVRFTADVLGGVPSITIGVFVYAFVVVSMHRFSAIAGAIALAVVMIPTVTRTSEELLRLVPHHLREAALGLGVPSYRVTLFVVLRTALPGVGTGMMLAVARIAGETAPLLFTGLQQPGLSFAVDRPIASLPVQILTYATSPYKDWQDQAWTGALVLVALVFVLNLSARIAAARRVELGARAGEHDAHHPPHAAHTWRLAGQRAAPFIAGGAPQDGRPRALRLVLRRPGAEGHPHGRRRPAGDRDHRPVRLRQVHLPPLPEPDARARSRRPGRGRVMLDGEDIYAAGVDPVACGGGWAWSSRAEPLPTMSIFDNVVAGLRLNGAASRTRTGRAGRARLRQAAPLGRGQGPARRSAAWPCPAASSSVCASPAPWPCEPEVLLMDEPCSALDPIATPRIEELIDELKSDVHDRHRDAQHAAGRARLGLHGVLLPGAARGVRPTDGIFTNPRESKTEDYVTGKFG